MPGLGLVLSGGSVRGVAHVGMLAVLEEYGLLDEIAVVVGTSSGSMMAALFALGYTPAEMWQIWREDVWRRCFGGKVSAGAVEDWNLRGLWQAAIHRDPSRFQGFLHGDKLLGAMETYLGSTPPPGVARSGRPRQLYLIATNFNTDEQTVFHFSRQVPPAAVPFERELAPALGRDAHWQVYDDADAQITRFPTVAQVCRCSSSLPFIFVPGRAPVQYADRLVDDLYTDGGVRDNYSLNTAIKLAGCDRVCGMFLGSYGPVQRPWAGLFDEAMRTVDQMGRSIFEGDQDDAMIQATNIRTLVPRFPASYSPFAVTALPAIYDAGRAVTREFLTRVQQAAGAVTWDTIFATKNLAATAAPPGAGALRPAQAPGAVPVSVSAPQVYYYIYEKDVV